MSQINNSTINCLIHNLPSEFICEQSQCQNRFLCKQCLQTKHYTEHKFSIVKLTEFLYEQNKRRPEIIDNQEKKMFKIKNTIEQYENFTQSKIKQLDGDFLKLKEIFNRMINQAQNYLQDHLSQDCKKIYQIYNNQKNEFRRHKENMLSRYNQNNDQLINFQQADLKTGIEQLVKKNQELNKQNEKLRSIQEFVEKNFDNRIYYNINENTQTLLEDLLNIIKFKLMLVRPEKQSELNTRITMIRNKIYKELIPSTQNLNETQNLSMTQTNLFTMSKDLEISHEQKLNIPNHVLELKKVFPDFKPPTKIENKSFINLQAKPSSLLEDGSIYEGQWDEDMVRNGRGKCLFPNGEYYDGYWLKGEPSLLGRFIYPDGTLYEGLLKHGQPHGKGILIKDQYKYMGNFQYGKKDGEGEETYPDGLNYKGLFHMDLYNGYGVLQLPNGNKYQGEFYEGKFQGQGKFYWTNKEEYEGEWADDKKHGKGKYIYSDGRIYEGDFVEDIPNGFGILKQVNGTIIEGFWSKGKPIGIVMEKDDDLKERSIFVQENEEINQSITLMD